LGLLGLGIFLARRMKAFSYIFVLYAGFLVLAVGFCVEDQNTFFLPALTLFSLFVGYGLLHVLRTLPPGRPTVLAATAFLVFLTAVPLLVYAAVPGWIAGLEPTERQAWEDRVVFNYGQRGQWELQAMWQAEDGDRHRLVEHYLNPNQRHDRVARKYGEALLQALPPDAVVLSEGGPGLVYHGRAALPPGRGEGATRPETYPLGAVG
jgi:hypothetical protein